MEIKSLNEMYLFNLNFRSLLHSTIKVVFSRLDLYSTFQAINFITGKVY